MDHGNSDLVIFMSTIVIIRLAALCSAVADAAKVDNILTSFTSDGYVFVRVSAGNATGSEGEEAFFNGLEDSLCSPHSFWFELLTTDLSYFI